jgi:type I restriction enzyme S subunit
MSLRRLRPLSELLEQDINNVEVCLDDQYKIAGVYSFGRGVFQRASIAGAETNYKTLHRLRASQLVMSRLKAFEGALAIVPPAFEGWFLSPEFPTFSCVDDELDAGYLAHICRWPEFWSMLATASKGIGARRERVHAENLLRLELRVPPIEEQRIAVTYLDSIYDSALSGSRYLTENDGRFVAALPTLIDALVSASATSYERVDDLADFMSDTIHPGEDPSPADAFVGLQHIESHTGRCIGSDTLESIRGRKFRFRPGDVVYGYLRPYQNKVWVADRHGLCSVDQYVLRPRQGVSPALLAHTLRGRRVLDSAIDLTHNLQLPRLRSGLLSSIEVPMVTGRAATKLAERLDLLRDRVAVLAAKRQLQIKLLKALIPAALNETFGSF